MTCLISLLQCILVIRDQILVQASLDFTPMFHLHYSPLLLLPYFLFSFFGTASVSISGANDEIGVENEGERLRRKFDEFTSRTKLDLALVLV